LNYLVDEFAFLTKKQKKTFNAISDIHKMQDSIKQIEVEFKEFEKTISQKQQDIAKECE